MIEEKQIVEESSFQKLAKLITRAKNQQFNITNACNEAENVKLNRKKILNDDLQTIIEEEGLQEEAQIPLEPC